MPTYLSSAVVLIVLFIGFIALIIWAWSKNRQSTFTQASNLPLEDDESFIDTSQTNVDSSTPKNTDER